MAPRFPSPWILAAAASAAVLAGSGPAAAGNRAVRCGWDGCAVIVCHDDGNSCYRIPAYADGYRYGGYYGPRYGYGYNDYRGDRGYGWPYYYPRDRAGWHYDCDSDGDRCIVRRSWGQW